MSAGCEADAQVERGVRPGGALRLHLCRQQACGGGARVPASRRGSLFKIKEAPSKGDELDELTELVAEVDRKPHGGIHALLPETAPRRVGPVGINLKKLRLPWWAVHQSVPRNTSHRHPSGRQMAQAWRHFKRR